METTELIHTLTADLQPVQRISEPVRRTLLWASCSILFVAFLLAMTGPYRPGFIGQFGQSLRFLLESLLGFLIAISAAYSALYLGLPGARSFLAGRFIPVFLLFLWFALLLYGLANPALEPSMAGKRPYCFYETLLYGIPPFLAVFWVLCRAASFERSWVGVLMGIAACSIPATLMQIACMYTPAHILGHHYLPVLIIAAIGGVVGKLLLPKI